AMNSANRQRSVRNRCTSSIGYGGLFGLPAPGNERAHKGNGGLAAPKSDRRRALCLLSMITPIRPFRDRVKRAT
ncbi:MAG: hypothetical protein R3212_13570, partial [Xanthomonadales bacterium]|nr:hypothetical protein [Xanthomonadales bacterium]